MATVDQEFDGFPRAALHVEMHLVHFGSLWHPVEENDGNMIAFESVEMVVLNGMLGQRNDNAVNPLLGHGFHDPLLAFFIVVRLPDQNMVLVLRGQVFYRTDGFGKEMFAQVGNDEADDAGAALFEGDGIPVGVIAHFPGQLLHLQAHPQADAFMTAQSP